MITMRSTIRLLSLVAVAGMVMLPASQPLPAQESAREKAKSDNRSASTNGSDAAGDAGAGEAEDQQGRRRQAQREQRQRRADQRDASQRSRPQAARQRAIRGTVVDVRQVDRTTGDGAYAAVLLRTSEGRRIPVALGEAQTVEKLNLQQNDQLRVSGRIVSSDGRPIFVAERAAANDQQVEVVHPEPRQQRARRGAVEEGSEWGRRAQVVGRIERMRVQSEGEAAATVAAVIRRGDGRRISANLGPVDRLEPLDLAEGDRVRVTGRVRQINGRTLLVAYNVGTSGGVADVRIQPRVGVWDLARQRDGLEDSRGGANYGPAFDDNLLNTMEFPTADGTLYEWEYDEREGDLEFAPFYD